MLEVSDIVPYIGGLPLTHRHAYTGLWADGGSLLYLHLH